MCIVYFVYFIFNTHLKSHSPVQHMNMFVLFNVLDSNTRFSSHSKEVLEAQLKALETIDTCLAEQSLKLNEVDGLIGVIDSKSSNLFVQCNTLLVKKNGVLTEIKAVKDELRYYDAFDELSQYFSVPSAIKFSDPIVKKHYEEICDCIDYFHAKVCSSNHKMTRLNHPNRHSSVEG